MFSDVCKVEKKVVAHEDVTMICGFWLPGCHEQIDHLFLYNAVSCGIGDLAHQYVRHYSLHLGTDCVDDFSKGEQDTDTFSQALSQFDLSEQFNPLFSHKFWSQRGEPMATNPACMHLPANPVFQHHEARSVLHTRESVSRLVTSNKDYQITERQ